MHLGYCNTPSLEYITCHYESLWVSVWYEWDQTAIWKLLHFGYGYTDEMDKEHCSGEYFCTAGANTLRHSLECFSNEHYFAVMQPIIKIFQHHRIRKFWNDYQKFNTCFQLFRSVVFYIKVMWIQIHEFSVFSAHLNRKYNPLGIPHTMHTDLDQLISGI